MAAADRPRPQAGAGLVVRTATDEDRESIVHLTREVHGDRNVAVVRSLLDDPRVGPSRFTVATDGDRVVSSLCLMAEVLRIDDLMLPMGQVEYVSTLPGYRRRGLVRAQFDIVHRWSAERGDLLQMILGIPAMYRRFGYAWAVEYPPVHMLGWGVGLEVPSGWQVREATRQDIGDLRRLHEAAQSAAPVARIRMERDWENLVRLGPDRDERVWVAVRGDRVRASGRLQHDDGRYWLAEPAAESREAAWALLAAVSRSVPPHALAIADRPGTPVESVLADLTVPLESFAPGAYIRVPAPLALLRRMRPILSARLKASAFADERGELLLTTYAAGIILRYDQGEVTEVRATESVEEPAPHQAGVPADLLGTLLLGRYGAAGLARRHPQEVWLNQRRSLMEVLFPRMRADVMPPY